MKNLLSIVVWLPVVYFLTSCCSCEDSTEAADSSNTDCWATVSEEEDYYDDEDDECDNYAPDDCITEKPSYGKVKIDITHNSLNLSVPITIYKGDFEDGNIVLKDTLSSDRTYRLPNGYYSVKAEYKVELTQGIVNVYSVDGWDLDSEKDSYCDATCYEEGTIYLDARLDLILFDNP